MGYYYLDNFADMIIFLRREFPSKPVIEDLLKDLFGQRMYQIKIHSRLQKPIEELRKIKIKKRIIKDADVRELAKEFNYKYSSMKLLAKMVQQGIFRRGWG